MEPTGQDGDGDAAAADPDAVELPPPPANPPCTTGKELYLANLNWCVQTKFVSMLLVVSFDQPNSQRLRWTTDAEVEAALSEYGTIEVLFYHFSKRNVKMLSSCRSGMKYLARGAQRAVPK